MSKAEIRNQIQALEKKQFFLNMKDRWNDDDYAFNDKLDAEIKELRNLYETLA